MRSYAVLTLPAALAVLLIAGSAARAAVPKACDLLTAQTAASLLGGPVGAPTDVQGMICSYSTKTAIVSLSVVAQPALTVADFSRAMQVSGQQTGIQQVLGLGDAGFFNPGGGDRNTVNVLYHHQAVSFSVQKKLTPQLKSQMIDQMKQWLAKF
jgi:hypothetical protein